MMSSSGAIESIYGGGDKCPRNPTKGIIRAKGVKEPSINVRVVDKCRRCLGRGPRLRQSIGGSLRTPANCGAEGHV